jgi:hemin uptake protein HemP
MTESLPHAIDQSAVEADPAAVPATSLRSEDLLGGQREILIIHAQEVYRLRVTRNGKLILTK